MNLKNLFSTLSYHFFSSGKDSQDLDEASAVFIIKDNIEKLQRTIHVNKLTHDAAKFYKHLIKESLGQNHPKQLPVSNSIRPKLGWLEGLDFTNNKKEEVDNVFIFSEYCSRQFERIRNAYNVTNEELIKSFDPTTNHRIFKRNLQKKRGGKSGMQIIMTKDRRFLIKEIEKQEKASLV